jgi:hypothetical protein
VTGADARRTQLGLCGWPTRRGDRAVPRQPTQRSLAAHAARWIVDTDAQVVTASVLDNGRWVEVGVWRDETDARIPPFDDAPRVALSLGAVAPTGARAPSA